MEILQGIHSIPAGTSAFMGISPPNVYLAVGDVGAAFIEPRVDEYQQQHQDHPETHVHRLHLEGPRHPLEQG